MKYFEIIDSNGDGKIQVLEFFAIPNLQLNRFWGLLITGVITIVGGDVVEDVVEGVGDVVEVIGETVEDIVVAIIGEDTLEVIEPVVTDFVHVIKDIDANNPINLVIKEASTALVEASPEALKPAMKCYTKLISKTIKPISSEKLCSPNEIGEAIVTAAEGLCDLHTICRLAKRAVKECPDETLKILPIMTDFQGKVNHNILKSFSNQNPSNNDLTDHLTVALKDIIKDMREFIDCVLADEFPNSKIGAVSLSVTVAGGKILTI